MPTSDRVYRLASDAEMLAVLLLEAADGDVVGFDAMSTVVGYRVDGGSPVVQRAIRIAFEAERAVFSNIRTVGYRRLPDEDIARNTGAQFAASARRKLGRGLERLGAVRDFDSLSRAGQVEHMASMVHLAKVAYQLSPTEIGKVRDAMAEQPAINHAAILSAAREVRK